MSHRSYWYAVWLEKRVYWGLCGAAMLTLAVLLVLLGYRGSFLWVNHFHASWLDAPMRMVTYLGDALLSGGLVFLLLRGRAPIAALAVLFGLLLTLIVVQTGKRLLFEAMPRPPGVWTAEQFHLAAASAKKHHGFPSGHTATIFLLATVLVLARRWQGWAQAGIALVALLVGYSRVYLGIHFVADVLAGMAVGIGLGLLVYRLLVPLGMNQSYSSLPKPYRRWGVLSWYVGALAVLISVLNHSWLQFYS
jgi:membrane-associated phospholipid phosphatase